MRIPIGGWLFTTRWSDEKNRPAIIRHVWPNPQFIIGISFWGCAIVKRDWWNEWTDYGKKAA